MIISFSGLGGSGKSTQIKLLENKFRAKIVVLRDLFLWPKITSYINIKTFKHENKKTENPNAGIVKKIKLTIRSIFYFFDSWRIFLFVILPFSKGKFVICDRYIHDFFAELNFPNNKFSKLNDFLIKLLPKADLSLYLKISPEKSIKRKFENLNEKELQCFGELFDEINIVNKSIVVDAEKDKDKISQTLISIIENQNKFRKPENFYPFALYDFLINGNDQYFSESVVEFDFKKIIRLASNNRILWLFANRINGLQITTGERELFDKILSKGRSILAKKEKTLKYLLEVRKIAKLDFGIIKEGKDVEISSDIDLIFKNSVNFDKFISVMSKNAKIESTGIKKADVKIEGLMDLDLHQNISYANFEYVSNDFIWQNPNAANALALISHSLNELTLITLGDVYKIKMVDKLIDWKIVLSEAEKSGWGKALKSWMDLYDNPEKFSYEFPHKIPFWLIFNMKIKKYLRNLKPDIFKDFVNFLKSIRARIMNKIPWHEPWFNL